MVRQRLCIQYCDGLPPPQIGNNAPVPVNWDRSEGSDGLATAALGVGALGAMLGFIGFFGFGGALLSWMLALAVTVPLAIVGHSRARTATGRFSAVTGALLGLAPLAVFVTFVGICVAVGCD